MNVRAYEGGREVELRPWQRKSAEELAEAIGSRKHAVLVEPPGSGKTLAVLAALAAALGRGERAIVAVPYVSMLGVWARYRVVREDGTELRVVPLVSRAHAMCWYTPEVRADNPAIPCLDRKLSQGEKARKCPFYAPPSPFRHGGSGPFITVAEYDTASGGKLYVNVNRHSGKACEFYWQFREVAEADVVVMTYKKLVYEWCAGRLPLASVVVLDELEVFPLQTMLRLDVTESTLNELARGVRTTSLKMVAEIVDVKLAMRHGICKLGYGELADFWRAVHGGDPLPDRPTVRLCAPGRVVFVREMGADILARLAGGRAVVVGVTGTPLDDRDAARLLLMRSQPPRIVSNNRRVLGRYIVHVDGQIPVRGIWFKRPELYDDQVRQVCRKFREYIEWARRVGLPVFVPLIAYRHLDACGIDRSAVDRRGAHIEEFIEGKRDVLITARANRGVHFPHSRLATVILKRPYPDVEDLVIAWLRGDVAGELADKGRHARPRWGGREFIEVHARATLFHMLGRSTKSDSDVVVVLTPDARVIEEIEAMSQLVEMSVTYVKSLEEIERMLAALPPPPRGERA
jgi:hypothetical protein